MISASLAAAFSIAALGQESRQGIVREDPRFWALGSPSCRACHRPIYDAWVGSTHARSAEILTPAQRFDGGCVPCHLPDTEAFEEGVGCEACHGPGSAYADLDVMIDPFKRRAAALSDPLSACASCHNPGHDFHVERDLAGAARRIHPIAGTRR